MQASSSPTKGQRYRVVAGVEGTRPHAVIQDVVFRGQWSVRGRSYWAFESEFFTHLVEPEYVRVIEQMARRYEL